MMVVITVSCSPAKLRGDLTRWLIEIDTGVYVGNLSARVRDAVWERICMNIGSGRATMVYSANNEQKLEFRIHHSSWEPVDYDGIKLVRRKHQNNDDEAYRKHSKAAVQHMRHIQQHKSISLPDNSYAVIDVETTGLQETDEIIELGAIIICNGEQQEAFSTLVKTEKRIPQEISNLTGITTEMIAKDGKPLKEAIAQFQAFIGAFELVGYHPDFDMRFLQRACKTNDVPEIKNHLTDIQKMARKKLKRCVKFSLSAVAEHLGIEYERRHRVIDDCVLTYRIFEKLKEI